MAKFCGKIGYAVTSETSPGVWTESIVERVYYGDVTRDSRSLENGTGLNSNINIGNSFSVVADGYAYQNIFAIRYLVWMGTKWKVTNAEVQRPRLILQVGGVYNEQEN